MSEEPIIVLIDDVEVEAEPGMSIIRAADAADLYIPRLCFHPDLPPGGHCRLCTVKVNGRPQSACTFPVSDGLVIENDTDELNAHRRDIVEMLFVEGNHHCPACEASGNCELQAMAYRLGLVAPTMPYLRQPQDLDATHQDVYMDRDRCILCNRCVRASENVDGKYVFGLEGRGINQRIAVNGEHGLADTDMTTTDRAADICPTGCLTVKRQGWTTPAGQRTYDRHPIGTDIEERRSTG